MKFSRLLVCLVACLLVGVSATRSYGLPIIDVTVSSAPNAFGSPSWAPYVVNALNSLEFGLGNIGNRATDPTAYEIAGAIVAPGDAIVSSFNSWRGVVNPGSPFGAEYGNRLHGGLHITGDGVILFRLEDLQFAITSSDGNTLGFAGTFAGLNYSSTRRGIYWGADRVKGGGDDVIYTSGNGLTFVDELVYVGVGNAYDASFGPGSDQDKMDDVMLYIHTVQPIEVTFSYTLLGDLGNGDLPGPIASGFDSVLIAEVPEPVTASLGLMGMSGLALAALRRRSR